ncbi:MAG: hypothetical protein A2W30_01860 [Ignavibacteria bacterium RBG_16_36_9]|nr:MAG: hypothetical protein A2W30_01860 [Ignavibacteria bacterium RBG_16_36_9]
MKSILSQYLKIINAKFDEEIFINYFFLKTHITKILSGNIYRKIFQDDIFRSRKSNSAHKKNSLSQSIYSLRQN